MAAVRIGIGARWLADSDTSPAQIEPIASSPPLLMPSPCPAWGSKKKRTGYMEQRNGTQLSSRRLGCSIYRAAASAVPSVRVRPPSMFEKKSKRPRRLGTTVNVRCDGGCGGVHPMYVGRYLILWGGLSRCMDVCLSFAIIAKENYRKVLTVSIVHHQGNWQQCYLWFMIVNSVCEMIRKQHFNCRTSVQYRHKTALWIHVNEIHPNYHICNWITKLTKLTTC